MSTYNVFIFISIKAWKVRKKTDYKFWLSLETKNKPDSLVLLQIYLNKILKTKHI